MECKAFCFVYCFCRFFDLIETLWNVKDICAATEQELPDRFNRDIVECKGLKLAFRYAIRYRFNRDIVECKEVHSTFTLNGKSMI